MNQNQNVIKIPKKFRQKMIAKFDDLYIKAVERQILKEANINDIIDENELIAYIEISREDILKLYTQMINCEKEYFYVNNIKIRYILKEFFSQEQLSMENK